MRRALLLAVAGVVAAGVAGVVFATRGGGGEESAYRGSTPPSGIALPRFALHDERGARVTSRSLRGKAVLVTFLDTRCRASCPVIASAVAGGVARLTPSDRRRVAAVAITTDPLTDTPAAARTFLQRERASGKLRYLLGSVGELRPLWRAFAVVPSLDTGRHDFHSAPVRIYDRRGTWVTTQYAGVDLTPANLAHDLRTAAKS